MEQNVPFPQRRALNCDFDCNKKPKHTHREKESEKSSDEERKMKLVKTGTKMKKKRKEMEKHDSCCKSTISKFYRWIKQKKNEGISQFSKAKNTHIPRQRNL